MFRISLREQANRSFISEAKPIYYDIGQMRSNRMNFVIPLDF